MWKVWDKKSNINESTAEEYLARNKNIAEGDTVFLKVVDGRVNNVEVKRTLSTVFGIEPTLPDDEFIAEYERILATPPEDEIPKDEIPEEIPEEEETDTTTYAELAQVYKEGVNGLE